MARYRENQFLPGTANRPIGGVQNAPYTYPRRVVRYPEEIVTTEGGTRTSSYELTTKQLDRGFIRNILASDGSGLATDSTNLRRFNFQFNPGDIEQRVTMRSDVYFAVLQDPTQLVQPMSAVATFAFDIFLDRTMEVANGSNRGNSFDPFGVPNPAEDVYQAGVLSDLQILYSIIGQGISNDLIAQNLGVLKELAAREARGASVSEEERAEALSKIDAISSTSINANLNAGNAGFLIPLPVRVVFSELYMVDGFVTDTFVKFTKFNTAMVPIQAAVGITMNAMYLGFARQDTFLTSNLSEYFTDTALQQIEEEKQTATNNAEILNAARQSANKFVFACDPSDDWLAELGRTDQSSQIVRTVWYAYGNPYNPSTGGGYGGNSDREYKVGFRDSKEQAAAREASNDVPWTDGDLGWDDFVNFVPAEDPLSPPWGREKSGTGCRIEKLFNDGVQFTVSYTWTFDVYGAYDSYGGASAARVEAKKSGKPPLGAVVGSPGSYVRMEPQHRGSYTQTATASNAKQWREIRSDSIREGDPPTVNNAPYPYPVASNGRLTENEKDGNPGQPDDPDNPLYDKWYLVNLKATITIAGTSRQINHWEIIQGDQGFYHEVDLGWPNNTGYGVYDPSAVPTTSSSGN